MIGKISLVHILIFMILMNKEHKKIITKYFIKDKIDIEPYTYKNSIKIHIFFRRILGKSST